MEALLGQCDGKIINSDYQAFVLLRVALPAAKVAEFSAKLADFSRGSLHQLTGIEALLGQCDGKIINSDYQAFVLLRVALPAAKVAEFSAKLADFSRGSLQLLAIEE